jgi:hypothetical protein
MWMIPGSAGWALGDGFMAKINTALLASKGGLYMYDWRGFLGIEI